jgi:hypothetical protein
MAVQSDAFGVVKVTGADVDRMNRYIRDPDRENDRVDRAVRRARGLSKVPFTVTVNKPNELRD